MVNFIRQNPGNSSIDYGTTSAGILSLMAADSVTNHTATIQAKTGLLAMVDDVYFQQSTVNGYLVNTPPVAPPDGDSYIIGPSPTGAWSGQAKKIARWSGAASEWEFYTPRNGWMFESASARETYRYTANAWEIYYQEGTWTPQIVGRTIPGSQTYSTQLGFYTKNGRTITASFDLILTAFSGASGTAQVTGLPYPAGTGIRHSGVVGVVGNITFPPGCTAIGLYANGGDTAISLAQIGSGIYLVLDQSALAANSAIRGALTYSI